MSVPSPPLPSSRELAELWPHFHPWQPQELRLGQVLLHRVEAAVTVAEKQPLDALACHLLAAFPPVDGASLPDLTLRTGLPEAVQRTLLKSLVRRGCLQPSGNERWRLTERGERARATKEVPEERQQRRVFHFCDGMHNGLPAFVRWESRPEQALIPAPRTQWTFHPDALQQCLQAPEPWKLSHGFPADVQNVERLETGETGEANWEKVMLHHIVRLPVAIVAGRRCVGFALSLPSWELLPAPPLFHSSTLTEAAALVGADLAPPSLAGWAEAWDLARRPLGLPQGDVVQYESTEKGPQVTIRLPTNTGPRKKPLPTGETWLLAGTGTFRCAARIEFREE
jgi:hypothetical protein